MLWLWLQVIEPVRSRCLCVRVSAPSTADIQRMLAFVAKKESLSLPDSLSLRVAQASADWSVLVSVMGWLQGSACPKAHAM